MNALAIKKGASRHSAYDLRDPFNGPEETHLRPPPKGSS